MADRKIDIDSGNTADGDVHDIEVKVDNMLEIKHGSDGRDFGADPTSEAKPRPAILKIDNSKISPAAKAILNGNDTVADDPETVAAVDDINHHDGDEALEALDDTAKPKPSAKNFRAKLKDFFVAWWQNRRARWGTIVGLVVVLLALAILPPSRSFALNLVGVRATANLTVLDATTQLPLKNATVTMGAVSGKTDTKGHVDLSKVKLGSQDLIVQKVAFATTTKAITTSWGSNDLGDVALKAVGTQYLFKVTDYVSGAPVASAQAASGQATALADKKGSVILTVADISGDSLSVSITATGYRTKTISVKVGTTQVTNVALVNSSKTVYISKQTGKYDVYKADVDGTNKKLLLAATGTETSTNTLVPNADGEVVALANNRDTTRDSNGYLLQTLTLININTGAPTAIDHSERIQIIDWVGDRVVYVAIKAGASAANPSRYLLMSYDYKTNQRLQLDHANAFNDVVSANGAIYYATSNGYNGGISQFTKINADGSGKQALLVTEVWNVFRVDYADFHLAAADANYTYKLGDSKANTTTTTYSGQSRLYIDSPDGKHSLWVDDRDGKGTLVSYDTATHKETVLAQAAGISYPVRWLGNDTVIYRLDTPKETADYVVGLTGTAPKKITDVTDTPGVALWYFY